MITFSILAQYLCFYLMILITFFFTILLFTYLNMYNKRITALEILNSSAFRSVSVSCNRCNFKDARPIKNQQLIMLCCVFQSLWSHPLEAVASISW